MNSALSPAKQIFLDAIEKYAPGEWPEYLDEACGQDEALRRRVEVLLKAHVADESLLDAPAIEIVGTVSHEPTIAEEPGTVIGPYKLIEQIGEGGFGVVFLAEQTKPVRREVALKVVKAGMDTKEVVARFEAERQALAMMDHPNIAKVLGAGATESGRPYFVMELVRGIPITDYCDQCKLTTRERLKLFAAVCQAVQHAHQKGVIHRDLKPSNVLIAMQDGVATPKIIDFGVAKAINQQLTEHTLKTRFAQIIGTPLYMSPEQAELSPLGVDTRSDIYSLGVLLYELLTDTTPFDKERLHSASFDELRRIIRNEEPPRPSTRLSTLAAETAATVADHHRTDARQLQHAIRGDLDWIVMKAMEKDRTRRYESASSLARDVDRYLADEPVEACPPSAAYRFRKFVRRNKAECLAALAACLMLVLALIALGISNLRISRERSEKELALQARNVAIHRVEENLLKVIAVVDRTLTRVSEEQLANVPMLAPVRKHLLEDAHQVYEDLLQTEGANPKLLFETAKAGLRLGDIHFAFRDSLAAASAYERSLTILQQLAGDFPLNLEYQHELAKTQIRFVEVFMRLARHQEAESSVVKAIDLLEPLVSAEPSNLRFRQSLGRTYSTYGWLLARMGQPREHIETQEKAATIQEEILEESPDVPDYRYDLAMTYYRMTVYVPQIDKTWCEQAIVLFQGLADEFPEEPRYRDGLGQALWSLGNYECQEGDRAAAESVYLKSYGVLSQISMEYPNLRVYEMDIAQTCIAMARVLDSRGNLGEAGRYYQEAANHLKRRLELSPDYASGRYTLAKVLSHYGDLLLRLGEKRQASIVCREAIEHLELLPDNEKWNADYVLAMARRTLAATSQRKGQAELDEQIELDNPQSEADEQKEEVDLEPIEN